MNNKTSFLRPVQLPRTPAEWLEAVMNFLFFLCGMLAVGCVVLISVYMVVSGVPAIHKIGPLPFLFGTKWASTAAQPLFGILPFILSSIYGTLGGHPYRGAGGPADGSVPFQGRRAPGP